jgi:hypothetical protein
MSESDTENPKQGSSFTDDQGAKDEGSRSLLVYYSVLARLVMAVLLICAGYFTIPGVFIKTSPADFTYAAVLFIAGTGIFVTVTLLDLMKARGNGCIAVMNSSMYVIAACGLFAGGISFYPGVNTTVHPIGQYCFLVGSLVICGAVLWVSFVDKGSRFQMLQPEFSFLIRCFPFSMISILVTMLPTGYCPSSSSGQCSSNSFHCGAFCCACGSCLLQLRSCFPHASRVHW